MLFTYGINIISGDMAILKVGPQFDLSGDESMWRSEFHHEGISVQK